MGTFGGTQTHILYWEAENKPIDCDFHLNFDLFSVTKSSLFFLNFLVLLNLCTKILICTVYS